MKKKKGKYEKYEKALVKKIEEKTIKDSEELAIKQAEEEFVRLVIKGPSDEQLASIESQIEEYVLGNAAEAQLEAAIASHEEQMIEEAQLEANLARHEKQMIEDAQLEANLARHEKQMSSPTPEQLQDMQEAEMIRKLTSPTSDELQDMQEAEMMRQLTSPTSEELANMLEAEFVQSVDLHTPIVEVKRDEDERKKPSKADDEIFGSFGIEYLYHMTAIKNFPSIIEYGLWSHNAAHSKGLVSIDISNKQVNSRRNRIIGMVGKNLHDYVPFYFNQRNAMMWCKRSINQSLIILCINPNNLHLKDSLFTDGNAAAYNTIFYSDLEKLNKLHWQCIFSKTSGLEFDGGKRKRMAEGLIYEILNINKIKKIYCYNGRLAETCGHLIKGSDLDIEIDVNSQMYY